MLKGKKNYMKKFLSSVSLITMTSLAAFASTINIKDFGASVKNKAAQNTKAIQKAIDSCPEGGTVVVPKGKFLSGSLHLKSNMTFKIDGTLLASENADDYDFGFLMYKYYTDTRYFGLLNADCAYNLTICGKGCVDGNGWMKEGEWSLNKEKYPVWYKGNNRLIYDYGIAAKNQSLKYLESQNLTPYTASKEELSRAYSVRSTLVIFRDVHNVTIKDLTFVNPANHVINILDSDFIDIDNVQIYSYNINNGDGVGLICSHDAKIHNCIIDAGDDSIVFSAGVGSAASTTGEEGVYNIDIFDNKILHGHGGVAFGSHTALSIHDVHIFNNTFDCNEMPLRMKSAPANGGEVYNVVFENNKINDCKQAFIFSTDYNDAGTVSKYGAADKMAVFHDIIVRDCTASKISKNSIFIYSKEGEEKHYNILFKNVHFSDLGEQCTEYLDGGNNITIE